VSVRFEVKKPWNFYQNFSNTYSFKKTEDRLAPLAGLNSSNEYCCRNALPDAIILLLKLGAKPENREHLVNTLRSAAGYYYNQGEEEDNVFRAKLRRVIAKIQQT